MVKAGVYVQVGHISIVDRAHLAVLAMFPPLFVEMHYERSPWVSCSPNSPALDVLLVNSERVVIPSRHG